MFWLIADTHFGHARMQQLCGRPAGFEQMILRNMREMIGQDDVLIHLGDICFFDHDYWHKKLCESCICKRWLVMGNHESEETEWYLQNGWDFVGEEIVLMFSDKKVLLSHKPIIGFDETKYDLNIHGHHHNNENHEHTGKLTNKHVLIKCEHDYTLKPLSKKEIQKWQS